MKRFVAITMSVLLTIMALPLNVFAEYIYTDSAGNKKEVSWDQDKNQFFYVGGSGNVYVDTNGVTATNGATPVDELAQSNVIESDYYNQAYTSMVLLTIDAGGSLEQIELQLLRFAAIDKEDSGLEKISSVKSDAKTVVNNVETNSTNNRSVFKTDNTDVLLGPLKALSEGKTIDNGMETSLSGILREALAVKAESIFNLIKDLDSDTNLQYSAVCYTLNTLQILNEFSYETNSVVPDKITELLAKKCSGNMTLIELKSKLEADGAKNLLSEINEDVFAEAESAFKATRIYQAFLQDLSGEGAYYYTRELLAGKALSSAYVPLRTNVNNNPYLDIPDLDTFKSFNSTYGTLRKAVMISTSNKSVSQMFITGQLNSFRPATLRDFLENISDEKTFVVDAGYYNADTHEDHDWSGDERIQFTLGSDEVSLETESKDSEDTEEDNDDTDANADAAGEEVKEADDPFGITGSELSSIGDDAYSKYSSASDGTPSADDLKYDTLKGIVDDKKQSGGKFLELKSGMLVPVNSIVVAENESSGEAEYYIARLYGDKQQHVYALDPSKTYVDGSDFVNNDDLFSKEVTGFTNKYRKIGNGNNADGVDISGQIISKEDDPTEDAKLWYNVGQLKNPQIISIAALGSNAIVAPYYRVGWLDGSDLKYTGIAFNKVIMPNGTTIKRQVGDGDKAYYYTALNGTWYELTIKDGKSIIGNVQKDDLPPVKSADGKYYNVEKVSGGLKDVTDDTLKKSIEAITGNKVEDAKTDTKDDKDSEDETTNNLNSDGTPKEETTVAGEHLYQDAFGPQEVYAATPYDPYLVHDQKDAVNAYTKRAWDMAKGGGGSLDDKYEGLKKHYNDTGKAGSTWWQAYPSQIDTTVVKSSWGADDNNVLEIFPTQAAMDDLVKHANDGDTAAKSTIAYIYHWGGYAACTHSGDGKDDATASNAQLKHILKNKEAMKIALEYHFSTVNPMSNVSAGKIKTLAGSLAAGIIITGEWTGIRSYLSVIRTACSELANEGKLSQMQADALYHAVALGTATVYFNYDSNTVLEDVAKVAGAALAGAAIGAAMVASGGTAGIVIAGAALTGAAVGGTGEVINQSMTIQEAETFVQNVNTAGSLVVWDADDIMWLFDDEEASTVFKSGPYLQEQLVSNARDLLQTAVLKQVESPLEGIAEKMSNVVKTASSTYDGSVLNALYGTKDFLQTIGYQTSAMTVDIQNAIAILQAIFSSDINHHPGYTKFPDSARNRLIDAIPNENIKNSLKACLEVKEFAEQVMDKIGSYASLEGLATDIWKDIAAAAKKFDDENALSLDNTSNSNDDLFKSNGQAAKLTSNDVDAIAASIGPEAIKEVFNTWYNKPNHFTLGLNPKEQATLLGSKLLRQNINLNVEANLDSSNNNFNSWYGIAFALDCMNHTQLADAVVGFENKPIFRSAPTAGNAAYQDAIFNYMLLANIAESYPIRWDAVLDLDSPVFLDIYGNIVTESGLVVIPFAANSTLHKKVSILNSAFLHSYGSAKSFEMDTNDITDTAKAMVDGEYYFSMHEAKVVNSISEYPAFSDAGLTDEEAQILIPDEDSATWVINPIAINTDLGTISLNKIETTNMNAAKVLYTLTMSNYTENISSKSTENAFININSDISNILYQVMRGDRIENIDYEKEGLNTGNNYNPTIISQANKYENLIDQLSSLGTNSLISVPDVTTMPGIEYIIFFVYKILILVFIFYLLVQIYLATVSQTFGLGTIGKIFVAFLCIAVVIMSQPFIYKLSYYYTNRALLQDEAELIAMLNREKTLNNVELGVVNARNVEKESKIMLKVTEIDVDFFGYLSHIADAATVGSLTEYYSTHIQHDIETIVDEYEQRGSALYYDVEDLYDTSVITVDQSTNRLINVTKGTPAIAFRSPYYAFLDYLIRNVNDYNALIDSYDYGLVSSGDGSIRTIGLTDRYFNSSAFGISRHDILHNSNNIPANIDESILSFAAYDRCGIFAMYGIDGIDNRSIWTDEDLTNMRESAWYADNLPYQTEDYAEVEALSDYLDEEAINWVNRHKHMLGRISDETILKSLALHLSLAYNRYLGANGPKYFEIENISTNDILRVSTVAQEDVMTSSPFTFPKFILINAGLPGVYLSALLTMVTFILSIVKPATTIITFLVLILSLVIYRLLLNQKTEAIKGVMKHAVVLCGVNLSYSLILKFFMLLPMGIPTFVRILLLILVHMLFIAAYVWLLAVIVFNWRDFGSNAFSNMVHMRSVNIKEISTERIKDNKNSGRNIYERLKNSDKWRNKHK